jgi:hypothetical protein
VAGVNIPANPANWKFANEIDTFRCGIVENTILHNPAKTPKAGVENDQTLLE